MHLSQEMLQQLRHDVQLKIIDNLIKNINEAAEPFFPKISKE